MTDQTTPPKIGVDEWVSRSDERRERYGGRLGPLMIRLDRFGWWPRLAAVAVLAALFPLTTTSDYALRIGFNTLILAILAVGLNVSVGWAGLLDLGYVAFYGFGAYGFALVSSNQVGLHWNSWVAIVCVVIAAGGLGLLLGQTSRRLLGDYLAIVTLFFGQVFVEFTTNVAPNTLGGPNGIVGIDPIKVFGHSLISTRSYYYLMLVLIVVVIAALHLLDTSRLGRAWRAVREDPLAAAAMSIPVNSVKLLAFAFGAMVAALAGTVFAAFQASVFPNDFDTPFLILIYAGLILGGAGSIAGAVLGAVVVSVTFELLRNANEAGFIFYGLILLTLVVKMRPWRRLAIVLAALVAFGYAAYNIAGAISPSITAGQTGSGGWIGDALNTWVIVPSNATKAGNWGFVILIVALVALTQLKGIRRDILLVPTIYLAAFVWETRLVTEPSITRQILLGAILIVVMVARPQGLLGSKRIEIL